jgi:glutathione-specific gamma-glutamylcyclotransferase
VAVLPGYARSFCMRSIHHRGTEAEPGLVLALDEQDGASCEGLALAVAAGQEDQTLTMLRERELISSAYVEKDLTVTPVEGAPIRAVTYVIDAAHGQYCGRLPLEEQARIIAHATGGRGPNSEYLFNTTQHLAEIGLHDPDLEWLATRVRALVA